eukprot:gnl/TRDRNA2_/TRDRNA2_91214_c0_seq1.p1 gnl/TRDRNA2_/TRDRNA2_91214_c0~~gnl/TRDRNA2_/TRDRNA2_91214_c0_seq1.p1  ORF type:complete len:308 (+),score=28.40 gnl/TRDRNA2_/TRDRNA2_91214_c0_seq1:81-1004(+)
MMPSITAATLLVAVSVVSGKWSVTTQDGHHVPLRWPCTHAASQNALFWPQTLTGLLPRQAPSVSPSLRIPCRASAGGSAQSAPLTEEDIKRLEEQPVKTADDWIGLAAKWKTLAKATTAGDRRWTSFAAKQIVAVTEAARLTADRAQLTSEVLGFKELETAVTAWRVTTAAWEARELLDVVDTKQWTEEAAIAAAKAAIEVKNAARATAGVALSDQSKDWTTVADEWAEAAAELPALSAAATSQKEQGVPKSYPQNLAQVSPELFSTRITNACVFSGVSLLIVTVSLLLYQSSIYTRDVTVRLLEVS